MAGSGYAEGDTAFNPQTGQEAVFTGGKWVVKGSPQMPLPTGDDAALKELQTQANDAQWLAAKAQQFKAMQAGKPGQGSVQTGPMFKEIGIPHVAENLNPLPAIAAMIDPRISGLESISNQAWAHMRPAGSGPMRMPEIEGFQEAFPNINSWGRANNLNADRLQQDADTADAKLKFIDNFIRSGQGTFADANAAWGSQQKAAQAPAIPPPMAMVPDASSPIGASPAPGVAPPQNPTPQQAAILNWTPEKGLHP